MRMRWSAPIQVAAACGVRQAMPSRMRQQQGCRLLPRSPCAQPFTLPFVLCCRRSTWRLFRARPPQPPCGEYRACPWACPPFAFRPAHHPPACLPAQLWCLPVCLS